MGLICDPPCKYFNRGEMHAMEVMKVEENEGKVVKNGVALIYTATMGGGFQMGRCMGIAIMYFVCRASYSENPIIITRD